MPKLLSDAIQIGIAARNDHDIDLPFLFEEPESHAIFDVRGYAYIAEQYIWDKKILTAYKETMYQWHINDQFLCGRQFRYPPSETILAAWIADAQTSNIQHIFYNTRLLKPETNQGCKSKTAWALGFDNWTAFKKEHHPIRYKPITITNATK